MAASTKRSLVQAVIHCLALYRLFWDIDGR